jgi:N-acetyl-gamma-glutamyl-phosphate reductase
MHAVAVIGGSGYSGAELLRILATHPAAKVVLATASSSAGQRVDAVYPALAGVCDLTYAPLLPDAMPGVDLAFVALPSGEAMKIMPALRAMVNRVIDLGGDFRLQDTLLYERYYKHTHAAADLLPSAVYGLPELNRKAVAGATLVANPGCYPTSALLALLPALKRGLIAPSGIVITSYSGTSGAGRSSSVEMSFTELNENVRAYKIGTHQHIPEIEQVLSTAAGTPVTLSFVPHLLPITRGIHATVHATLTGDASAANVRALYQEFYRDEPFVRVKEQPAQIAAVTRTNFCDIHPTVEPRTRQLIVTSVIDNLVKGAAGQAVQNMNIMFGLPESTGL